MKNKYLISSVASLLVISAVVALLFLNKKEGANSAITAESPTPKSATICEGEPALPSPTYDKEVLDKYTQCKEIIVFFKEGTKDESAITLTEEIKKLEGVKSAEYISQQKALEIYKENNKDEPLLLESISADMLPASINISITDSAFREQIISFTEANTLVHGVIK